MTARIIIFVVLAAVVKPMSGSLYGDKESVIEEIEKKYVEVADYSLKVFTETENEESKTESGAEDEVKKFLETEVNKLVLEYGQESNSTVRYGIALKHKMNCIRCTISIKIEGDNNIASHYTQFKNDIENVRKNKITQLKKLDLELYTVGNGAKQLKDQKIREINQANERFDQFKVETVQMMKTSMELINEIRKDIPKINLVDEYSKIKGKISSKFAEIKKYYFDRLEDCLRNY